MAFAPAHGLARMAECWSSSLSQKARPIGHPSMVVCSALSAATTFITDIQSQRQSTYIQHLCEQLWQIITPLSRHRRRWIMTNLHYHSMQIRSLHMSSAHSITIQKQSSMLHGMAASVSSSRTEGTQVPSSHFCYHMAVPGKALETSSMECRMPAPALSEPTHFP